MNGHLSIFRLINFYCFRVWASEFGIPNRYTSFKIALDTALLNMYICRQLKQHQHKIKSKTGISLEITPNVFKCLIVSLVPLHFPRALFFQRARIYKFSNIHQKDLNLCLSLYYYGKSGHCWIWKKTQTRNLTVLTVLVIWPSSTLKFLFVFSCN